MPDVVNAVVGEELGVGMELVRVPALLLEDAELREPLGDEEEVADGAGAGEGPRNVRGPANLGRGRASWRHRGWKRGGQDRAVRGIPVVRRNVMRGARHVGQRGRLRRPAGCLNVDVLQSPAGVLRPRASTCERGCLQPGRAVVPPGVPVEVKPDREAGRVVVFRQVTTSRPVIVRAAGSSVTSMSNWRFAATGWRTRPSVPGRRR